MGTLAVPSAWQRLMPRGAAQKADAALGALVLVAALGVVSTLDSVRSPAYAITWCVVLAGSVAVRRRAPLAAALASVAGVVGYQLATRDRTGAIPPVAVVLTYYTLGRSGLVRRRPLLGLAAVGVAFAGSLVNLAGTHAAVAQAALSLLPLAVGPLVAGIVVGERHATNRRLAEVLDQLRAEREHQATRATTEERNRVARDLHDVVAHGVSVMIVQAGAARMVARRDPAATDRALAVIGGCGREALVDLRRIVGVLRRGEDGGFGGGSGLGDLERLAERMRLAGVPTVLSVDRRTELSAELDLVAYRAVQEALTNVVKHAGPGARAQVEVRVDASAVVLRIADQGGVGTHAAASAGAHQGHGLTGMGERVGAYGGVLEAGPSAGGYLVHVRIPQVPRTDPVSDLPGGARPPRRVALPSWTWDASVVTMWLVAMEVEAATSSARQGPWALNALAVGAMSLAAAWRRRAPLVFLAVVAVLTTALSGGLTSLDRSTIAGLYALSVPLFTVAAWDSRVRAVVGLVFWLSGASLVAWLHHAPVGGLIGACVMGTVAWSGGRAWRAQRTTYAGLAEASAALADERDRVAALAVATERTRIARELHGLVADRVVTMVVQAEAARGILARPGQDVEPAIRAIERSGRDALTQLRRILGVLRRTENETATEGNSDDGACPDRGRPAAGQRRLLDDPVAGT